MKFHLATAFVLVAALAASLPAQGALSTQGFGYPPGQLSTRAASMGGGPGETDPLSPLNPAALATWGRSGLYFQYSPEFRSVTAGGQTSNTTTARFPVVEGALTVGRRAVIGLSVSTLLDRTWETQRTGFDHFESDSAPFTERFQSAGAINDIQLGVAAAVVHSLWLGVGGHLYSGENRLRATRSSVDTTFANLTQLSVLSYSGAGASAGIAWQPVTPLIIGLSGGLGGTITSYRSDSALTRGKAPKRLGGGVSFTLPGLALAARAEWQGWSSLAPLGNPGLGVTDAWDYGVGAEVRGPSLFGAALPVRVGYRRRTLPFTVDGTDVRENTVSVGLGIPLSQARSRFDLGLARANRGSVNGVAEHAWTFSAGFMVRP